MIYALATMMTLCGAAAEFAMAPPEAPSTDEFLVDPPPYESPDASLVDPPPYESPDASLVDEEPVEEEEDDEEVDTEDDMGPVEDVVEDDMGPAEEDFFEESAGNYADMDDASEDMEDDFEDDFGAFLEENDMVGETPEGHDSTKYAQDKQNSSQFENIDLENLEADDRYFVVDGAVRCSRNGAVPKLREIITVDKQIYGEGNCQYECATRSDDKTCYGFSVNSAGDCEFYFEPVNTFESSTNDYEFEGNACYVKGVNCGGHFAINCEHCPTPGSDKPETECNGQCIYDYQLDDVNKVTLGACIGIKVDEHKQENTVNCGAHRATSCSACATRYTFHCAGKQRYCNGDCSWERGDCGFCPKEEEEKEGEGYLVSPSPAYETETVETTTMTTTASPTTTQTRDVIGEGFEGTDFNSALTNMGSFFN